MLSRKSITVPGIVLALILVSATWLRIPVISAGMPFFYHEDEAHHFNRVVEMVKEGRFDPIYFHKPSLHFYLRMPVVATSFLWNVQRGHLRSVQEIETKSPYGLGKYAFAVSHPGIVKWNRAFSVLLAIGTILIVFLISRRLFAGSWPPLVATALLAVSPDFVRLSGVIGVDIVMTFMAALTTWLALWWYQSRRESTPLFTAMALAAGLTVSSKYNALPIMALPVFLAVLCRREHPELLWRAILFPWIGFLAGSPYILSHLPLFLDHLAYEVWHYGVAGHAGNMAEPGVEQFIFYSSWLATEGIGPVGATAAGAGVILLATLLVRSRAPRHTDCLLVLIFPLLFGVLMCAQKTNFTRNMVVLIPFAAIAATLALYELSKRQSCPRWLLNIVIGTAVLIPGVTSFQARSAILDAPESRNEILTMIREQRDATTPDTAIAGQLQFPSWVYRAPGILRFSEETASPLDLYLDGYDRIIVRSDAYRSARGALLEVEREIVGERGTQRVVRNPAISVLKFREGAELATALTSYLTGPDIQTIHCPLESTTEQPFTPCTLGGSAGTAQEPYLWLTRRWTKLVLPGTPNSEQSAGLLLSVRTPWPTQQLEVVTPTARHQFSFSTENAGEWRDLVVPLASAQEIARGILLRITNIHSPRDRGIGEDPRRLGLALRGIRLLPPLEK